MNKQPNQPTEQQRNMTIRNVTLGPLTIGYNAGDTDNYSWYKLGGFTFQPTELAKISFILTFAMHLNNVRSRINEPKELAKLLLHLDHMPYYQSELKAPRPPPNKQQLSRE